MTTVILSSISVLLYLCALRRASAACYHWGRSGGAFLTLCSGGAAAVLLSRTHAVFCVLVVKARISFDLAPLHGTAVAVASFWWCPGGCVGHRDPLVSCQGESFCITPYCVGLLTVKWVCGVSGLWPQSLQLHLKWEKHCSTDQFCLSNFGQCSLMAIVKSFSCTPSLTR